MGASRAKNAGFVKGKNEAFDRMIEIKGSLMGVEGLRLLGCFLDYRGLRN